MTFIYKLYNSIDLRVKDSSTLCDFCVTSISPQDVGKLSFWRESFSFVMCRKNDIRILDSCKKVIQFVGTSAQSHSQFLDWCEKKYVSVFCWKWLSWTAMFLIRFLRKIDKVNDFCKKVVQIGWLPSYDLHMSLIWVWHESHMSLTWVWHEFCSKLMSKSCAKVCPSLLVMAHSWWHLCGHT